MALAEYARTALHTALAGRCDDVSPPGAWRSAAASAGVSGADAFLSHLSRSIAAALENVTSAAEFAHTQLRSTRTILISAVNSRCDELEERIAAAKKSKTAALERELCTVDAALERLRSERADAASTAASVDDAELAARYNELTAHLDAAEALLLDLPTTVVEPPHVGLNIDTSALLADIAVFGRVVAPQAITAADLTLEAAAPPRALPGCTMLMRLELQSTSHASQSADELEVSLGAAAAATLIEALLKVEGAAPQPLVAALRADTGIPGRGVTISIVVPQDAPIGSSVCFGPLTVSGQPVVWDTNGLLSPLLVEPPGPAGVLPEHAAQLQAWLPPGGSPSPGAWEEVYRATTHGFSAAEYHARCDGRARLLVLIREQEEGWLFGSFTATGCSPPERFIADPSAFLFSLTNSLGCPEKLESERTGYDIYYSPSFLACFGVPDLCLCENADTEANSYTETGRAFAASASTGAHPMARGLQRGWRAAEVVAWAV